MPNLHTTDAISAAELNHLFHAWLCEKFCIGRVSGSFGIKCFNSFDVDTCKHQIQNPKKYCFLKFDVIDYKFSHRNQCEKIVLATCEETCYQPVIG